MTSAPNHRFRQARENKFGNIPTHNRIHTPIGRFHRYCNYVQQRLILYIPFDFLGDNTFSRLLPYLILL